MRIIVAGCGKVGETIVSKLTGEGHDIAVIDVNNRVIGSITDNYDVMGIVGNSASYSVQKDAGIEDTDLLIAVTDSDEENLLTCLFAKKAGNCNTIARVRNPVYWKELPYIKEELGLSMTINPEYAAATEAARILRFPSAMKIDIFARGRVELLQFVIPEGSMIADCSLIEMAKKIGGGVLVCSVVRDNEVYIPNGQFVLQAKDTVGVIIAPNRIKDFFKRIGVETHSVRNTIIVGGGKIAYYLATQLLNYGIDVKIIERDIERCEELSEQLPKATIINADGTDQDVLLEEGVETCGSFVSLTGIDEENVFLSLIVKKLNPNAKVITKTNRSNIDFLIQGMDLGTLIHPKSITAEYILRFVRAMQNSIGSNMETLYYIVEGKAEALEFTIHEDAPVIGIPLSQLKLKENVLIACIYRARQIIIPDGQSSIEVGDSVIIVTTHRGFGDIRDILADA